MQRTARFRVRKRNGRTEWLRSSKLARSIARALTAVGAQSNRVASYCVPGEEWRTVDFTTTVLTGLRGELYDDQPLETARIGEAVQQLFCATGFVDVASAFARVSNEQHRRRSAMLDAATELPGALMHLPDDPRGATPPGPGGTPDPPSRGGRV